MRSRKFHYFRGATSLCGKWLFAGHLEPLTEGRSADDCPACWKALDKSKGAPRPETPAAPDGATPQ